MYFLYLLVNNKRENIYNQTKFKWIDFKVKLMKSIT